MSLIGVFCPMGRRPLDQRRADDNAITWNVVQMIGFMLGMDMIQRYIRRIAFAIAYEMSFHGRRNDGRSR